MNITNEGVGETPSFLKPSRPKVDIYSEGGKGKSNEKYV